MALIVGTDLGGCLAVRIGKHRGPKREITPVAGSLAALRRLALEGVELALVSRASKAVEDASRRWLELHGFTALFAPERCHFCRDVNSKLATILKSGCDVWVDDSVELLRALRRSGSSMTLLLYAESPAMRPHRGVFDVVHSWDGVLRRVLRLAASGR